MSLTSNKKHFNIYDYDAQLARAFQSDCENLLEKFRKLENLSFSTFANVWREMNFIQIFKGQGQEYILMLQAFLENCFFITKKFLFSNDLYIQTGAVYILYGLYYKQPIKNWVKIRLTRIEIDKLNDITEEQKSASLDLAFIYNKLRIDEAFQYCALPQPLGLEARFQKRKDLSINDVNIKLNKESSLNKFKKMIEQDADLTRLETTDLEYQKVASKYREKCKELFVFPSKSSKDLREAYNAVFNNDQEDETRAGEIKELKNRAASNINAVYRGERRVVTALDFEPSTSGS